MRKNRNQKFGDNNQKSVAIKNLEMTSSRGGLKEPPPPNLDVASLSTRWKSCAQKDSFFFLPCSSDSCSVHRIGSCRNQKIGDDKFERRPWRAPPQILTSPASPGGGNRAYKKILFFPFPAAPILTTAVIKK
jgi:hypothetical protein